MKAEEEDEFREFAISRRAALVRTAYLLCGDSGHAEDLAQSTLSKAYLAWGRLRGLDEPDAYVRRTMINLHISSTRRKRVLETLTWRMPERGADPGRTDGLAERSALLSALAALPPRQRAVVVLRYWEDRSESDVAALMGCSIGTVRSQAHRALAKLRTAPELCGLDDSEDDLRRISR